MDFSVADSVILVTAVLLSFRITMHTLLFIFLAFKNSHLLHTNYFTIDLYKFYFPDEFCSFCHFLACFFVQGDRLLFYETFLSGQLEQNITSIQLLRHNKTFMNIIIYADVVTIFALIQTR